MERSGGGAMMKLTGGVVAAVVGILSMTLGEREYRLLPNTVLRITNRMTSEEPREFPP